MIFAYDLHHSWHASCLVVSDLDAMRTHAVPKVKTAMTTKICAATALPDSREAISAAVLAAGHAEEAVADHYPAEM